MPTFGFEPGQARALGLLLMSWKKQNLPPQYIPAPEEAAAAPVGRGARGEGAAGRGGSGIRPRDLPHARVQQSDSVGEGKVIGPDLKGVGSKRPEDWLRSWLADPAAMIRFIPSSPTGLTSSMRS